MKKILMLLLATSAYAGHPGGFIAGGIRTEGTVTEGNIAEIIDKTTIKDSGIATTNIIATGAEAELTAVQFDTTNTNLASEGEIRFVDEQGGLVIGMPGGGQLTVGAEGQIRVYNDTGSAMPNGTVVSIDGKQGNFPKAILCSATNVASCGIIGMVTTDAGIEDGHYGQVAVWGTVRDVDGMTGYSAGDILYLSETDGAFTSTAPSYPSEPFMIGKVLSVTGDTGDIELRLDGWKTWAMLDAQYAQKLWTENAASSGRLWGGAITVDGTTITVAAGGGLCKGDTVTSLSDIPSSITDGFGSPLSYVTWDETTLTAVEGYNIIFWDGSAGAMTNVLKSALFDTYDEAQDFTVGRTYYDTVYGHVSRLCGQNVWSAQRRNQLYHDFKAPVELVQGGVVSADGLKLAVTAGRLVAEGYDHFSFDAITTNDNFNVWYQTNSVWTYTATNTLDDATYNDVTEADGETALTPNRWRVDYAYLLHDGSLHILKGQAEYVSQSLAEDAARATPPDLLAAYGTIIARIAVQEGSGAALIANVDSVAFSQATAPDLSGYALTDLSNTTAGSGTNVTYTANSTNFYMQVVFTNGAYQAQLVAE